MIGARDYMKAGLGGAGFGSLLWGILFTFGQMIHPTGSHPAIAPMGLPFATILTLLYSIIPCVLASLLLGPIARLVYEAKAERNVVWMKWLLAVAAVVAGWAMARDQQRGFGFLLIVAPLFFYPLTALLVLDRIVRTKASATLGGEAP